MNNLRDRKNKLLPIGYCLHVLTRIEVLSDQAVTVKCQFITEKNYNLKEIEKYYNCHAVQFRFWCASHNFQKLLSFDINFFSGREICKDQLLVCSSEDVNKLEIILDGIVGYAKEDLKECLDHVDGDEIK